MADQVSEQPTNRLSLYLRFLNALEANDVRTVSSQRLFAKICHISETSVSVASAMS